MDGEDRFKQSLVQRFPSERKGIEKYFDLVEQTKNYEVINGLVKIIPLWLSWIVAKSGVLKLIFN